MLLRKPPVVLRLIIIGALCHVYIGARLIPDMLSGLPSVIASLYLPLSWGLITFSLLDRAPMQTAWRERCVWLGLAALGLFSSLFVLTFIRDLLLISLRLIGLDQIMHFSWTTLHTVSAACTAALALLVTLLGFYNARRLAQIVTVDVPIAGLPPALDGFTITQISDLHIGNTIKKPYIQAIVDATNATAPDLIAITGDVVDGRVEQLAYAAEPLSQLRAPHGVYLVTGNHEYYSGAGPWIAEFRRLGLHVLMNEHVLIRPNPDCAMVIAGVTDYRADAFEPSQASDPAAALVGAPADVWLRILLAHQPRSAIAAEPLGYTLQLSGHTHGGQFLPWRFFVRYQQPYTAGLHRLGRMWIYIHRGTGYWGPPKRLGAPSEITRLRLRRASTTER